MECIRDQFHEGVVLDGRFRIDRDLNHGSFGAVFVATDLTTDEQVAIKILTKKSAVPDGMDTSFAIDDAADELACHELLGNHKNTVNLLHTWESDSHVYMALEFCPYGDLYEAIRIDHGPNNTEEVKDFIQQLVDAVEYLHSKGLYHRDIKAENIFLCPNQVFKLGDFGLATRNDWCYDTTVGSDRYMAPEQYDSAGAGYSPAQADIWAIGLILLNVLFAKNPFMKPTMEDKIFLDYSRDSQSLFDVFTDMSQDTFDVIKCCMSLDPKKRSLQKVREAIERVVSFTDGFDDEEDCRPTPFVREPVAFVTANREPLRTPTIKSTMSSEGLTAFPWQQALRESAAQPIRQLSVIREPDNLCESYSEDLFSTSTENSSHWSYIKVATPGTSMMESSLGASVFSNYNMLTGRPALKKLPSLASVSGSLPINMDKSRAMASVFGKKEAVAKSWSDMWDEDEDEDEVDEIEERKVQNNARTFSHEETKVDVDESAVVFEEDEEEAVVLSTKKDSDLNLQKSVSGEKTENEMQHEVFGDIDGDSASDAFFFQQDTPKKVEKKAPAIYTPPCKRNSDAADKWTALGARRRGLTGESMDKAPTSWRTDKRNVGMTTGSGIGFGSSLGTGVWDHKPAATGGVYYNNNQYKAKGALSRGFGQPHQQSPINFSRNNNYKTHNHNHLLVGRYEQENVDHTARGASLEEDAGDLEWVGGGRVGGLQL